MPLPSSDPMLTDASGAEDQDRDDQDQNQLGDAQILEQHVLLLMGWIGEQMILCNAAKARR